MTTFRVTLVLKTPSGEFRHVVTLEADSDSELEVKVSELEESIEEHSNSVIVGKQIKKGAGP